MRVYEEVSETKVDECCDLYLANMIDTGNLHDSWMENKEYIEKVCELTGTNEECGFDLDNEEKKLVYVGKTDSQKSHIPEDTL